MTPEHILRDKLRKIEALFAGAATPGEKAAAGAAAERQALRQGNQLGDVDQLPSVGPGQALADMIASGAVPVVRLDRGVSPGREEPDHRQRPPHQSGPNAGPQPARRRKATSITSRPTIRRPPSPASSIW